MIKIFSAFALLIPFDFHVFLPLFYQYAVITATSRKLSAKNCIMGLFEYNLKWFCRRICPSLNTITEQGCINGTDI